MYHVNAEDTTYFPERWGTLVNFRSAYDYGAVIFLSTSKKTLYHREYTLDVTGTKWYSDWIATASNSDFAIDKNAVGVNFEANTGANDFYAITIARDDGVKGSLNFSKTNGLRYLEYRNGTWSTIWSK